MPRNSDKAELIDTIAERIEGWAPLSPAQCREQAEQIVEQVTASLWREAQRNAPEV